MSNSKVVYFNSRQDALNRGFSPCKVCRP
ncbi:MAG: hypothetical protein IJQ16_09050 [Selenomonadaceae bacterium]|nr:hypothetical protein [Selenomonadaceae bacterium]